MPDELNPPVMGPENFRSMISLDEDIAAGRSAFQGMTVHTCFPRASTATRIYRSTPGHLRGPPAPLRSTRRTVQPPAWTTPPTRPKEDVEYVEVAIQEDIHWLGSLGRPVLLCPLTILLEMYFSTPWSLSSRAGPMRL